MKMTMRLHLRLCHFLAQQPQVSICCCVAAHCCADHVPCSGALHMSCASMPEQSNLFLAPDGDGQLFGAATAGPVTCALFLRMRSVLSCNVACRQHAVLPEIAAAF